MKRRSMLAALGAAFVAGCSKIGETQAFRSLASKSDDWHQGLHNMLGRRTALAPEYPESAISPFFRGNGSQTVDSDAYREALANGFPDWQLTVTGLVSTPLSLDLAQLRALPQRTQITRHDCVEGWSAIGKWTGPQLRHLLDLARVGEEARFVVFRCADNLNGEDYYESVDLVDAYHPQTIIAHSLNDEPLPERNGAPLRVRIERQLGYKHAKYLTGIEVVASLDDIGEGRGGYWEDRSDYQWYAGI